MHTCLGAVLVAGVHTYANGASYDGDWESDKMHGYGIYTFDTKDWSVELLVRMPKELICWETGDLVLLW